MFSTDYTIRSSVSEEAALKLLFRAQALTLIDQDLEQSSSSYMPEDQRSAERDGRETEYSTIFRLQVIDCGDAGEDQPETG